MHAGNVLVDNLGDGENHNDHYHGSDNNNNNGDKQDMGDPEKPTNKL